MADRGEQNFVWVNNEVYVFNENKQEKRIQVLQRLRRRWQNPKMPVATAVATWLITLYGEVIWMIRMNLNPYVVIKYWKLKTCGPESIEQTRKHVKEDQHSGAVCLNLCTPEITGSSLIMLLLLLF